VLFTVYGGRDERQNQKEDRYQSRQSPYPQVLASSESGNNLQKKNKKSEYIFLFFKI
jgi:hypothetical protein